MNAETSTPNKRAAGRSFARSSPFFAILLGVALTACSALSSSLLPAKSGLGAPPPTPTATTASSTSPAVAATRSTVASPYPAATSTNPTTAAIQAVIQRADAEQVDAFTKNNPSLMQDTATSAYYQQLVQINQDLANSGATSIKLAALEWGPITTQGSNTAQATTYESWVTAYSDGHTDVQTHDRNVYTLVQENGAWKIQSDDHPDDQPNQPGAETPVATAPVGTPAPTPPPFGEMPGTRPNESANWSGYSATGGTFTAVTGTWTVPTIDASGFTPTTGRRSNFAGDATWVGIGGVHGRDLIQAGTEATVVGPGDTIYDAWIEMLPQSSQPVTLNVSPGDSVTVAIKNQGQDSWSITLTNNTTNQQFQATVQYPSSESSAEWIEEAPSGGRRVVPLDRFGTINFSGGSTVESGKTLTIAQAGGQAVTMIDRNDQPIAVPSKPGNDGASFSVTRS